MIAGVHDCRCWRLKDLLHLVERDGGSAAVLDFADCLFLADVAIFADWEVNDVRHHHLDLAERLEQTLRGFVAATRRPGPLQAPALPDLDADRAGANPNPQEEPS